MNSSKKIASPHNIRRLATFWALLALALQGYTQQSAVPDPVFRKFLLQTYGSSVITPNGNVDWTGAYQVKGTLKCVNCGFTNVEGLQYFVNLTGVVLDSNQLSTLPILYAFKELQVLSVKACGMDSLPDLSLNSKLTQLYVAHNQLKQVKGIDKLVALHQFHGWDNKFTTFPPLDKLANIFFFDAAINNLNEAPYFGKTSRITYLNFFYNNISTLPDYSGYTNLRGSWIYQNNLTFKELAKLSKVPNYEKVFNVSPMRPVNIGRQLHLNEGDTLLLSIGIDSHEPHMSYEWYKVGQNEPIATGDTFQKICTAQDAGKYVCRIKQNLYFPNLVIWTDTFFVTTRPCFDATTLSVTVSEINCTKPGAIQVKTDPLPANTPLYLTSLSKNKTIVSYSGTFNDLTEQAYIVSIPSSESFCAQNVKSVTVPMQACKDFLVTPDNDGNMDSFYFQASGTVKIFDKRGVAIKEMKIPGEWDCTTDTGKVPIGYYIAYINDGETQIGLSIMY